MRGAIGVWVRRAILWPIPPDYAGQFVVMLLLTVAGIAIAGLHSFPEVATAAGVSAALTFGVPAVYQRARKPG